MATMVENIITAGFENRPSMLEKGIYDRWKTRITLYIPGKEKGEMLKDSIDNGPFQLKPEITAKDTDGFTEIHRPQKVEDLSTQEKLRYDSDIKAVNILLLGFPVDIYTLINHYQTAKEIWDRVKELMIGTKMTKQEPAKQARDLHSVNFDQLYAFLKHNEKDTKEVREMQQRFPKPLAFLANTYNPPPSYSSRQIQYHTQPSEVYQPTQATIQNGQVTVQNIQGHIAKQCTAKKGMKDTEWFKDNMLFAQAQEAGVVDHADAYDSDYDDEATPNAIFMENLSPVGSINDDTVEPRYDSYILSKVPHYDTYHESDVLNFDIQELEYIENIVSNNEAYDELTSNNNVISYADYMVTIVNDKDNYVPPPVQNNDKILSVIEHMIIQVEKLYDTEETLILAEESRLKMLEKQTMINTKPIDYSKLNKLYDDFVPQKQLSAEQLYLSSTPSPPESVSKPTKVFPKRLPSTSQVLKKLNNARDLLRRVSSTDASGSKPKRNTKNDRILQPSSRSKKNKVEARHRKFKSSANKNNHVSYCNDEELPPWKFDYLGYGDLQMRNILISYVYYVEGLGHNLFPVGQFCDSDLKVAFRKHTCFVRNLEGVDLLSGSRGSSLYTILMVDMMQSSPICLLSKASKTKSWLWHCRLSHLNFESINKKRYILVIVDDYSRFTWVKFLRTKDEAPEIIIKFLKQAQVSLNAIVRYLRTDNGTEFINQTLRNYTEEVGITHHTSTGRIPQQNGVVERRNRTLVEATRTMHIFSKYLLFLWAEAIATACNSQVKDNKIDLLVQQYEQFTILEEESIDSDFARFNTIITSLKDLDEGFSSKNYIRKFLRALHPKWRAKVTAIKESKVLSSLALDELIGNLKVHEVVMVKDSEIYKGKKELIKPIALKAKKESSDDETSTFGRDDEEYAMAVRNFKKFFRRKGKFVRKPREERKSSTKR
ncbi:retrovirus-related pol polyprotein from transposon TNT 1-94 [Tanacetum coccineum]|uniref:Retrovirus-related pol polyprotein from transposon TNT 1-94 n=1 Tax=Tanacetum coccineum TaxID=301880 RepID=A0ABQ5EMT3_9ASTR